MGGARSRSASGSGAGKGAAGGGPGSAAPRMRVARSTHVLRGTPKGSRTAFTDASAKLYPIHLTCCGFKLSRRGC